jgi:hypothetical protein
VLEHGSYQNNNLVIPFDDKVKEFLIFLCASHKQKDDNLIFEKYSEPLIRCLGLEVIDGEERVQAG